MTKSRIIRKPQPHVAGQNTEVLVYLDTVLLGTQPTIDYTRGIATFASPVSVGTYNWTGCFDVPVRFDSDIPALSYDFYGHDGGGVSWNNIEIVELPDSEFHT